MAFYARTALLLLQFATAALLELSAPLVRRGLDLVVRRNGSKLLSGATIGLLPHLEMFQWHEKLQAGQGFFLLTSLPLQAFAPSQLWLMVLPRAVHIPLEISDLDEILFISS